MNSNDTDINTAATRLLGVEGVGVIHVEDDGIGGTVVHVVTTDESARACPTCGVFSSARKERVATGPRHLPCGGRPTVIRWHKTRWRCSESRCPRASFTEQTPQMPARMRITQPLRHEAGKAVADGGRTVVQAGRDLGLSWPIVHRALITYATQALDEHPAPTEAIGIDETRRGKPVWKHNPTTGKWELIADAWHIGFVDAIGGHGLFGQVEGRNSASVAAWLTAQPEHWKAQVKYVAIDLCSTFRAAVRQALPDATVVVDCFHIVQLAQRHLADLRRRLTWKQHGRRARKGDAIYTVRKLLRRNKEDLTPEQLTALKGELTQMGTYGRQIHQAWQAKELLRDLLRLTFKHTHITPDRTAISAARYRFQNFCADRPHLPELLTLAETVDQWWHGIEAYIRTGITNAASEGNNRLIKLEARNAFGFRNRENQRLRSRCATTRRSRRQALPG
ncbi:ISL3 family transposase [Streptomyces sp. H10-C2]|uniref:ISL3 family transposase n=1 Tax=unclassified Streptomyces TaxID=2593676 RepID=UPI0024B9DC41|nr:MULTISPECIES: ISL3 family transposase [unclassified Streptomyces]MDJ0347665.1 ISL3 family transposase [Streptomyces sp. PH10-H1]MDJ0375834.1 ISL3 family transposase [Streptomyces sp. H10-C2]